VAVEWKRLRFAFPQKNGVARSNENMDDEMARFYADLADDDSSTSGTYPQTDKSATAASQNVGQRQARISSAASSPVSNRAADDDDLANDEFLETIENHDDISGTRCQAPFGTEWSSAHYYNAMIMDVERADDDEGRARDDVRVRVLFLNPAVEQMKPCPYLLDGTCRWVGGIWNRVPLFRMTHPLQLKTTESPRPLPSDNFEDFI